MLLEPSNALLQSSTRRREPANLSRWATGDTATLLRQKQSNDTMGIPGATQNRKNFANPKFTTVAMKYPIPFHLYLLGLSLIPLLCHAPPYSIFPSAHCLFLTPNSTAATPQSS